MKQFQHWKSNHGSKTIGWQHTVWDRGRRVPVWVTRTERFLLIFYFFSQHTVRDRGRWMPVWVTRTGIICHRWQPQCTVRTHFLHFITNISNSFTQIQFALENCVKFGGKRNQLILYRSALWDQHQFNAMLSLSIIFSAGSHSNQVIFCWKGLMETGMDNQLCIGSQSKN